MKQLVLITLFLICSINSYGDAGLAFRYKVELQDAHQRITGYVYHYTYSEGFKKDQESFCDYFAREFQNTPYIYREIHTLNLSKNFEFDFYLPNNKLEFDPENLLHVNLLEKQEFMAGDKIFLIENEDIYNLIGKRKFQHESIDYRLSEHCNLYIVDFSMKSDLKAIKNDLNGEIDKYYIDEPGHVSEEFYKIYKEFKENLLKDRVLIFEYCSAL